MGMRCTSAALLSDCQVASWRRRCIRSLNLQSAEHAAPVTASLSQPKEIGLPFTAYYAVDEVREVCGVQGYRGDRHELLRKACIERGATRGCDAGVQQQRAQACCHQRHPQHRFWLSACMQRPGSTPYGSAALVPGAPASSWGACSCSCGGMHRLLWRVADKCLSPSHHWNFAGWHGEGAEGVCLCPYRGRPNRGGGDWCVGLGASKGETQIGSGSKDGKFRWVLDDEMHASGIGCSTGHAQMREVLPDLWF